MSEGIVYILTNAAMPGFIKIGLTQQDDVSLRVKGLDNTSLPLPFECYFSARVPDCRKLERTLHFVFGEKRDRLNREFFTASPDLAKAIKVETDMARKAVSKPVRRAVESRAPVRGEKKVDAPVKAPAGVNAAVVKPRAGITAPAQMATQPRMGITAKMPAPAARRMTGAADQSAGRAAFERAAQPQMSAGKPTFGMQKAGRLAELKAKAEAPNASQYDKDRYKFAARSGMVGNFAAGGAAKTRKGQAPIKKGK